tara:strand:+ start:92 stop:505 length:414 start_codon:yes stop_codon:yes gene_type:complete
MIFTIHSNIKNRSTVEEYVANLCKELGISRLKRTIDIRFKKNLDEDAWGYCWGDEDSVDIEINRQLSFEEQMTVLAHEMVHAKQYFRKELTWDWRWKKRNYSQCSYEHQPWEKQARLLEDKLYSKCWPTNSARSSAG